MGFDHSLNAEINFKPGVTLDQAIAALDPMALYLGWSKEDLVSGGKLPDEGTAVFTTEDGNVTHASIYSCGEVRSDFDGLVRQVAANLNQMALPGNIELRDYDTADLDEAIIHIWYGDEDGIVIAKRMVLWESLKTSLQDVEVPDSLIQFVAEVGQFWPHGQSINSQKGDGNSLFGFLRKLASTKGCVAINAGIVSFEDGSSFHLANAILDRTITLKKGSEAVIQYGGMYVPCEVISINPSLEHQRFKHHKVVKITRDALDLAVGDVITSEVGNVFPKAAIGPGGLGLLDYTEICD